MICDKCKGNGFISDGFGRENIYYRPEFRYLAGINNKKNIIQCKKCNSQGEIKEERDDKTIG